MKIYLDTNIVIDILSARKPHFDESFSAFTKIIKNLDTPCIGASSITDVFYILRKYISDKNERLKKVQNFLNLIEVLDTKKIYFAWCF